MTTSTVNVDIASLYRTSCIWYDYYSLIVVWIVVSDISLLLVPAVVILMFIFEMWEYLSNTST